MGEKSDLVSHGTDTTGQNECYGDYNTTTETGNGPGYVNSCIHSDSNEYSGGDTVWYNYVTASVGTIANKDAADIIGNLNTAIESVCPKGWTLPAKKQIDDNRSISSFSPVQGGYYTNANLNNSSVGIWWGNEAYNGTRRYSLRLGDGPALYTSSYHRGYGFYIRCVSEEKAITSLTYMQDMTSVAV